LFFGFFSQDDIFMALALCKKIAVVRVGATPARGSL
jgi:hypothetical protein